MAIFCLLSTIWSGSIVLAKIYWRQTIHSLNMAWFAVSLTGFIYFMGWVQ